MMHMGEASDVYGLEIQCNLENKTIFIHQILYAETMLERLDMNDSRSMLTPRDVSSKSESFL